MTLFKRKIKAFFSVLMLLIVMAGNGFLLLKIFEKQMYLKQNAESLSHSVTIDIRTGGVIGDSPLNPSHKPAITTPNLVFESQVQNPASQATPSEQSHATQQQAPNNQDNSASKLSVDVAAGLDDPNHTTAEQKAKIIAVYGAPIVAILVTDVGLSASSVHSVLSLPPEISIGISPYGNNLVNLSNKLSSLGHTIFMDLPLEPKNYPVDDPGQFALLNGFSDEENLDHLNMLMSTAPNIVGMYTKNEEKFTLIEKNARILFNYLMDKNLMYLYASSTENIAIDQYAIRYRFPMLYSDLTLDTELSDESIIAKLLELEARAKASGFAVAIANPYPITLKILDKWISTLAIKNIKLVKLDKLYQVLNS